MKIFSLQCNFLRPSPYDLRTEENDANFLPYQIKKSHHVSYQKILQYKEPEIYLFFNPKYTSPFTFNSEYLIDHTKTNGKLRNYDPLKQSFLFLPNDNPKRPIIFPQEYLILRRYNACSMEKFQQSRLGKVQTVKSFFRQILLLLTPFAWPTIRPKEVRELQTVPSKLRMISVEAKLGMVCRI